MDSSAVGWNGLKRFWAWIARLAMKKRFQKSMRPLDGRSEFGRRIICWCPHIRNHRCVSGSVLIVSGNRSSVWFPITRKSGSSRSEKSWWNFNSHSSWPVSDNKASEDGRKYSRYMTSLCDASCKRAFANQGHLRLKARRCTEFQAKICEHDAARLKNEFRPSFKKQSKTIFLGEGNSMIATISFSAKKWCKDQRLVR